MDDDKYFTIQVKGTAYRFSPIPEEALAMVLTVVNMRVSQAKSLQAISQVLRESGGEEQWDALADRMIAGEVKPADLADIFKEIMKRQTEGGKAAPRVKAVARKRAQ